MMIKIPAYVTNAIGELPIDWSLEKIEELAYFQEGPGLRQWQYRDSGIPFLNIRCIKTNGTIDFTSVQYLDENEVQKKYSHFLLNENDTVISSSGTLGKIAVIKKSHLPLLLNTSIIRFVSLDENKLDNKFMRFLLESKLFSKQYRFLSQGSAQANFGPTHLKQMYFPNAPILEQQKIATILSTVDEAIEKAEQIIEQTHYVKNGVLKKLMSRGIGHTKFKDSEVGRIPLNWEVKNLDELSIKILGGGTPSRKKSEYYNGEIPWVTVKDLGEKLEIDQSLEYITELGLQNSAAKIIPKNNLLISTRMAVGKILKNRVDVSINQDMKGIIVDKSKITVDFFLYAYINKKSNIERMGTGTTVKGVRLETLKKINFAIPPLQEQEQVTNVVNELESKIGNEKRNLKSLILLKQGLMQQLLTGKVRVPMSENEEVPQ